MKESPRPVTQRSLQTWASAPCRRLIVVLIGICFGSTWLLAQSGPRDETLSVRRIIVDPKLVGRELEKVQQGTLMLVPLKDLETRLERARKQMEARKLKPRLVRALYRAELVDFALTNGSGQWTVQSSAAAPSVLPIDP